MGIRVEALRPWGCALLSCWWEERGEGNAYEDRRRSIRVVILSLEIVTPHYVWVQLMCLRKLASNTNSIPCLKKRVKYLWHFSDTIFIWHFSNTIFLPLDLSLILSWYPTCIGTHMPLASVVWEFNALQEADMLTEEFFLKNNHRQEIFLASTLALIWNIVSFKILLNWKSI